MLVSLLIIGLFTCHYTIVTGSPAVSRGTPSAVLWPTGCGHVEDQNLFCWPTQTGPIYATGRKPSSTTLRYAPPPSELVTLVESATYTTWATVATPTDSENPYGNVAWSALWASANFTLEPLPYTTTVQTAPVAQSELIKPNPLPIPTTSPNKGEELPKDFIWGFSGAAIQMEGAIKEEGRTPSIIEAGLSKTPGITSPNLAALNYYLYKQDIARLAAVGVQSYSFSISWTRILPFAHPGSPINKQGIDHYNDLINTVIEYGMNPIVTLVHFDSPLYYATNTSTFGYDHPEYVDGFVNYAKICITHFGDRVPIWITFNEPNAEALGSGNYASVRNVLTAHARVVQWYRQTVQGSAKLSLKIAGALGVPLDSKNASHIAAANRYQEFYNGNFANPLYGGLQTPRSISDTLGFNFSAEELQMINGTSDFYAFDIYDVSYVTPPPEGIEACATDPSNRLYPECVVLTDMRDGWAVGYKSNDYPEMFTQYVRTIFSWIWKLYRPSGGIMVTEFGFPTYGAANKTLEYQRENLPQSIFYEGFLNEMYKSIHEDGVHIIGAIGWSYVDHWKWGSYDTRFGVQTVNETTQVKTYKSSIFHYVDWFRRYGAE